VTDSANVKLVRSICAAWQRGDYSSAEWAHPEIEFVRPDGPEPGSWTGMAGMGAYWRDFLGTWQSFRSEPEDYRELDDERVLVLVRNSGRGKRSGTDFVSKNVTLFHIRNGKVIRLSLYFDRARALADLGLAPQGDAADVAD
jgi:ketosteroid isomerase-like protein